MFMWSSSLCGISFQTVPSFPVVEFLFTAPSTDWSGLVRSALKKDPALFLIFADVGPFATLQMLTHISDLTEICCRVGFHLTRSLNELLNILFILLAAAKFC